MVNCTTCGKVIDRVPDWLFGVKVDFICTNCPGRQIKSITQLQAEQLAAAAPKSSEVEDLEGVEGFDEDDEAL